MQGRTSLKLRIFADAIMAFAFDIVVPIALAPVSKNWQTTLMTSASFFLSAAFWFDLLRTIWRFQGKLPLN
jgi:hypothetical protein